ncbi:hypothetical protein Enr10x_03420 [Gimesia panareensis]|uniref:Lipoprotein n=1 Tax=Gimesia panareensis TaxID=2527978 RepID=A0A517Q0A0_9PLAN|nr:hypothetical protein [Gimesia panareensis]QDT25048.1 hypothetical protein Enr10x_03420 [Gimesia panareensis]
MKVLSTRFFSLMLVIVPLVSSGCSLLPHSMHPSQWYKLNQVEAPRKDMYFSVPDPIPELEQQVHQTRSVTEDAQD